MLEAALALWATETSFVLNKYPCDQFSSKIGEKLLGRRVNMKEIIAKRVSMSELFYDLIFVYAISKITAMIHHPVSGSLPLFSYFEFVIVVIIVMQIWLYQALYINRFGKSR